MASLLSRSRGVPDPFPLRGTLSLWWIQVDKNSLLSFSFLAYHVLSSDLAVLSFERSPILSFPSETQPLGDEQLHYLLGHTFFPSVIWVLGQQQPSVSPPVTKGKGSWATSLSPDIENIVMRAGNRCTEPLAWAGMVWFISFGSALALSSPSWFLADPWEDLPVLQPVEVCIFDAASWKKIEASWNLNLD